MAGPLFAIILASIPVALIGHLIASTGVNTLSGFDYFLTNEVYSVVDVTSHDYNWLNYFRDTFRLGSYSIAVPFSIRMLVVHFTDWNMYGELWATWILSMLEVFLLWDAFTSKSKSLVRWATLPTIAALEFSLTQVNQFTWGVSGLHIQTGETTFAIGLWALARYPRTRLGTTLILSSAILTTFSSTVGVAAWPVLLFGMLLVGERRRSHIVAWGIGAALTGLIYVAYLNPASDTAPGHGLHMPSINFMVRALGQPLSTDLGWSDSLAPGLFGVLLIGSSIVIALALLKKGMPPLRVAVPTCLLTYGIINILAVATFRATLSKWYPAFFVLPWEALVGYQVLFLDVRSKRSALARKKPTLITQGLLILPVMSIIFAGFFWFQSNKGFDTKQVYLVARTPTIASCLREYRTDISSPFSTCSRYFYGLYAPLVPNKTDPKYFTGQPKLLEAHSLSVFGHDRETTLQGDYFLPTVRVGGPAGPAAISWHDGKSETPIVVDDWRHLTLKLGTNSWVRWVVHIPRSTTSASLRLDVGSMGGDRTQTNNRAKISASAIDRRGHAVSQPKRVSKTLRFSDDWTAGSIDLTRFAGQDVAITMRSLDGSVLLRYPRIAMHVESPKSGDQLVHSQPKSSAGDLEFGESLWDSTDPVPNYVNVWNFALGRPHVKAFDGFSLRNNVHLCVGDFDELMLTTRSSGSGWKGALVMMGNGTNPNPTASIMVPIIGSHRAETSTISLKRIVAPPKAYVDWIKIQPMVWMTTQPPAGKQHLSVTNLKLLHSPGARTCD